MFAIGATIVTCSAWDDYNNTSLPRSFTIKVTDTTPPLLHLPSDIALLTTSAAGMTVNYTVTASDAVDPLPSFDCAPLSGSAFPIGSTTVHCTANDAAGNSTAGSFKVTIYRGVNLLKGSDFNGAQIFPFPWKPTGIPYPYVSVLDRLIFLSPSTSVHFAGSSKYQYLSGTQTLSRSGLIGEKFTFGVYTRANLVPLGGLYQIELKFYNLTGAVVSTNILPLSAGTYDFQMYSASMTVPANYRRITYRFVFQKSSGEAWFDDAFLFPSP
jgi:hypothetical protein